MLPVAQIERRMVGRLVTSESGKNVETQFVVLFRHLPGRTGEKHEEH
jgi:hypothetical protein